MRIDIQPQVGFLPNARVDVKPFGHLMQLAGVDINSTAAVSTVIAGVGYIGELLQSLNRDFVDGNEGIQALKLSWLDSQLQHSRCTLQEINSASRTTGSATEAILWLTLGDILHWEFSSTAIFRYAGCTVQSTYDISYNRGQLVAQSGRLSVYAMALLQPH